jgi:hypothetical protein
MSTGEPGLLSLFVRDETLAIARLAPREPWPSWVPESGFVALARTEDEVSIVCPLEIVPEGIHAVAGWRALQVVGPLDFAMTGVLARLASALAAAGIPVFVVSTFSTDIILVREDRLAKAVDALLAAGYPVLPAK